MFHLTWSRDDRLLCLLHFCHLNTKPVMLPPTRLLISLICTPHAFRLIFSESVLISCSVNPRFKNVKWVSLTFFQP